MLTYLENLRKKPESERRKAVLSISVGVTLVIALIWGVTLSFRIGETDFSLKKDERNIPSLKETFSGFFDQVGNIFDRETTTAE